MRKTRKIAVVLVLVTVLCFSLVPSAMAPKPQPKATGIHGYDANGQYLGILMTHGGPYFIQIFIPSIGKFINAMKYQIYPDMSSIIYQTNDCTGPEFLISLSTTYPDHVAYRSDIDKIYIMMAREWITMNSYYNFESGECFVGTNTNFYVPIIEIAPEELPFTLPLALPLRYEYESR